MSTPGPRRNRPFVLGLVLLAAVGAGCSSPSAKSSTPSPTGATTGSGPHPDLNPPAEAPGVDEARMQAIVLSPADLPGWTARASQSTPNLRAAAGLAMAQCLGRRNIDVNQVAGVVSQDFSKGGATITSSAKSYLSDDDISVAIASFTNPKAPSCYQQSTAVPGATQNLVVKITPGPGTGPENVVATANFFNGPPATTTPTQKTTKTTTRTTSAVRPAGLLGTIVFIRGPRLMVELDLFGSENELPAQLRNDLIAKVAARAAKG